MASRESRPTPTNWRRMRLLAPNLVTGASLIFGLLSLVAAHEARYVDAAWLIVYSVMADRLDGLVARRLRGESELGVQLDSLADFMNFGVAPAFLFVTSLGAVPTLPFQSGGGRIFLMLSAAAWVLGAVFRLARYNISNAEETGVRMFFGVPTTLAAGTVICWYLTLVKYGGPNYPIAAEPFGGPKLFGGWQSPAWVWEYAPAVLLLGGFLMASNLRIPGAGKTGRNFSTVFIMVNVVLGFVCGTFRIFPEYMIWPPTLWLLLFIFWGMSSDARAIRPPPVFPKQAGN